MVEILVAIVVIVVGWVAGVAFVIKPMHTKSIRDSLEEEVDLQKRLSLSYQSCHQRRRTVRNTKAEPKVVDEEGMKVVLEEEVPKR